MGVQNKKSILHFKTNQIKMAFHIYEQPAFSMEHFHPGFFQPLRSMTRPKHWNILENLFDQEETACQSNQSCCSSKSVKKSVEKSSYSRTVEDTKTNKEKTDLEPVTISKRF